MKRDTVILWVLMLLLVSCNHGNLKIEKQIHNPIVPGYFADPTIHKFGDTFYLYSTTDGIKLASGEPQVWISKDFVNWFNFEMEMDIPEGLTNVWAPDVFQGADGRFYFFMGNCQFGCNIYGYVSESPMGPWVPLNDGKPVIEVGTALDRLPALDAQYLLDDDGSVYAYFGTWCHLFGGMGWAKISPDDNFTILETGHIPMSEIPEAFEAVYPLKRNGKYFLMYSSGDCRLSSYAVHYSVSDSPTGPFTYGINSPVLKTSDDGLIDSPGHHSVLNDDGKYYILYHRHDIPHSTGGMFRQICADRMVFANDTTILPVEASHKGIGFLGPNQVPFPNLALGARASASSYYHLVSEATKFSKTDIDYQYLPSNATDDNNATLWKAGSNGLPQSLVVDLGSVRDVKRVMTQFEYPTFYYQYKIECSNDSVNWQLFSDKTNNRRSGSPMIDDNSMSARYIRVTVNGTEKQGVYAAIWNVKVYDELFEVPDYRNKPSPEGPGVQGDGSMLVYFDSNDLNYGIVKSNPQNKGTLNGEFLRYGSPMVKWVDSVKAVSFKGSDYFKLNQKAPESLNWNAAFTVAAWVYHENPGVGECIMVWNSRASMLQGSYTALMFGTGHYGAVAHGDGYIDMAYRNMPEVGKWHHIALSFDGMKEVLYVSGITEREQPIHLFVESGDVLIGASGQPQENFRGSIANAQLFDKPLNHQEVLKLMEDTRPQKTPYPPSPERYKL